MGRGRNIFWPLTASGIVGGNSGAQPVTLHGWILTETGGVTNETLTFYIPTVTIANAQDPAAPSASGTQIFELIVPKGTTLAPMHIEEPGLYFKDGLYVAISGGTLSGGLIIS